MTYRDEREAMRERLDVVEQDLAEARARLQESAGLEKALAAKEKEVARLRMKLGAAGRPRSYGIFIAIALAVIFAGMASMFFIVTSEPPEPVIVPTPSPVAPQETVVAPSPSAAPEPPPVPRFALHPNGLVPLRRDGRPEALLATMMESGKPTNVYFVERLDGAPPLSRWRAGPYPAGEHMRLAAAGERAVFVDGVGRAHVLDVESGSEVGVLALSDRPDRVCIDHGLAFIDTVDRKATSVDLATLEERHGPRSTACPVLDDGAADVCFSASATCLPVARAPRLPGASPIAMVEQADDAVVVAVKSPGTRMLVVAGVDRGARAVRWRTDVASGPDAEPLGNYPRARFDLADGLFAILEEHKDGSSRLVAVDARSGERRWTAEIPYSRTGPPLSMAVGGARVYVTKGNQLRILARESGELVAAYGNP